MKKTFAILAMAVSSTVFAADYVSVDVDTVKGRDGAADSTAQYIRAGKEIIGFDLNEVAPGESGDWDANVGARALWNLVCATEKSRKASN